MSKKTRLRFTAEESAESVKKKGKAPQAPAPKEKAASPKTLRFEENRPKAPSKLVHPAAEAVRLETHQAIRRENTDDNVAAEAAQTGEEVTGAALHGSVRAAKQIREHRTQPNHREAPAEDGKTRQKQAVKRRYAKAKTAEKANEGRSAGTGAGAIVRSTAEKIQRGIQKLRQNPKGAAIVLALFVMLSVLTNVVSSCSLIVEGIGSAVAGSTYPSSDAAMLAAEAEYCAMEAQLQQSLDNYERDHDYDEYEFDLDEIKHDPYVLISTITALHGGEWTIDEVRPTLQMLFDRQYTLTETETTETRPDPDSPEAGLEEYTSVKVELKNNDLSHLQYEIMTDEQLSRYSVFMSTLGNRPDLFPGSEYIGRYGEDSYIRYDIPPEALEDEVFAAMIAEAEKYLGYPYVWGGSSPSTSFDCSGFVCWVINHSGWNAGRTTAQGLCDFCTPVRASEAKPGDLVFFKGTYDTPEISHVGIYVGNNMMIHCGDPITYSNLNSSYWQAHLYCYGRLP